MALIYLTYGTFFIGLPWKVFEFFSKSACFEVIVSFLLLSTDQRVCCARFKRQYKIYYYYYYYYEVQVNLYASQLII
jgi:hypothetical protein